MKYIRPDLLFVISAISIFSCDDKYEIKVDSSIEQVFSDYVAYWSDADFEKIAIEIYDTPFVIYENDSTTVMNTDDEIKQYLISTFQVLESNNYGYSIRNKWEYYKSQNNVSIVEMNFTRFLKDSTVMGELERSASYVLRKTDGRYKIVGIIPLSPISE